MVTKKRGRGRPPVYASKINGLKVNDGWVDICEQQNRTAPSGYRARYPLNDFRVVPNTLEGQQGGKPFVLQSRRLRKAEKEAREQKVAARLIAEAEAEFATSPDHVEV